jgi:hypothetical protein
MAIREQTYVVTADQRFHAVVDQSPTLKGAVRLLGAQQPSSKLISDNIS